MIRKKQNSDKYVAGKESAKKRMLVQFAPFGNNAQYRLQKQSCEQKYVKLDLKSSMLKFTVIIMRGK